MGRIAAIPFFHPKTAHVKKNNNNLSYYYDKVPSYLQKIFTSIDIKLKSKCTANKITNENELGIPIIIVKEEYLEDFKKYIETCPKYLQKFKDLKELLNLFRADVYCMYYLHIPDESQGSLFLESRFCPSNEEVNILKAIDEYVLKIKEDFYTYLEEWVGLVINLAAEYVMFKLKFPAIFFNCEECLRPGLFIKNKTYCCENDSLEGQKLWGTANIVDVLIYSNANKYGFNKSKENNNLIKSNLIYHDESFFKRREEVYYDCEFFQRHINGAFILTVDEKSFNLAMDEIKSKGTQEQFCLIVAGSNSKKILEILKKKNYMSYINSIYIYAFFIEKYQNLKVENQKVKEIFFDKGEIIDYMQEQDLDLPIYKLTNLITFEDYNYKYHLLHKMISEQYGNYTADSYNTAISIIQDLIYWYPNLKIEVEESSDKTKIESLITILQNFKDISYNESSLIKKYSQNTGSFYKDFNKWLLELDPFAYKKISWFIASFMYQINRYKDKPYEKNGLTKSCKLFRGIEMNYTDLLLYQRCEGKKICFPSFTSTSAKRNIAEYFSKRDMTTPAERKNLKIFSVILIINYIYCKEFISYAIDISKCSDFPDELERIFLPFTFFKLKEVSINYADNTADIVMDSIGKKEILELKLNKENNLVYKEYTNGIGFMEVE